MKKSTVIIGLFIAAQSLFCAAVALLCDRIIGVGGFNLVFQESYGVMYYIDIFPHIMGGMACGLAALSFTEICFSSYRFARSDDRFFAILFASVIGLSWEFYEVSAGYAAMEQAVSQLYYIVGTLKDLTDDVIGGALAVSIAHSKPMKFLRLYVEFRFGSPRHESIKLDQS